MSVVVQDEEGVEAWEGVIGGYLGDVRSRVEYCLEADVEGGEEAVAGVRDVLRLGRGREGGGDGKREWEERVGKLF